MLTILAYLYVHACRSLLDDFACGTKFYLHCAAVTNQVHATADASIGEALAAQFAASYGCNSLVIEEDALTIILLPSNGSKPFF